MKILPLEKPLISPMFGKRCVYYYSKVFAVYENFVEVVYEEEKGVEYLVFEKVNKKRYRKFYPVGKTTTDPFSFLTAKDVLDLVKTDLIGFLVEEEVLEL